MSGARRQAILDAALRAFTDKGAAATVDDVRALSGASVGSIYHWFDGKEDIATALYAEALGSYQEGYLAALRGSADPQRGIKAVVRHHLRWVEANPDLARFLFDRREGGERVRELNRQVFAATASWLEPHVESGRVRRMPLDLYYALLIGPSQEFARHWLQGRMKTSIRQAEPVLAEAAWCALRTEGG
jgi:AcrR family transcriptional regulator